jgi:hypothetical protein
MGLAMLMSKLLGYGSVNICNGSDRRNDLSQMAQKGTGGHCHSLNFAVFYYGLTTKNPLPRPVIEELP